MKVSVFTFQQKTQTLDDSVILVHLIHTLNSLINVSLLVLRRELKSKMTGLYFLDFIQRVKIALFNL